MSESLRESRILRRLALKPYRFVKLYAKRLRHRGRNRYCPVCDSHVAAFLSFGVNVRDDAMCPICETMERHRLYWLYYQQRTSLTQGGVSMLHFAPEMGLEARLDQISGLQRVTADLFSGLVDVRADLMNFPFPDSSFDVIHCSHVLEHVADDRKSLRELHRVLGDDGWGLIQVSIWAEGRITFEDASIVDPQEHERVYGQYDHVRLYGRDFLARLAEAGFSVDMTTAADIATSGELERMGIPAEEEIFHCRRAR